MKCEGDMNENDVETSKPSVKKLLEEFQRIEDDSKFRKPPLPIRRAPPPPPPHRKQPTSSSSLHGPKPVPAPKPLHLHGLIGSNSASAILENNSEGPSTPRILVSPVSDKSYEDSENNDLVRTRAKFLENIGFVPRSQLPQPMDRPRPLSEVSTVSQRSEDFDDGDTTSEDESSVDDNNSLDRVQREEEFDQQLPLPATERKTTFNTNTHSEIMQEMEKMGFVKTKAASSGGVAKKVSEPRMATRRVSTTDHEIPSDVGKLRENRKARHNSLFVPSTSRASTTSDEFSRFDMERDRSSSVTTTSGEGSDLANVAYDTGDEEEDRRLKKLHFAAAEFEKVQMNYVRYLKQMTLFYPEYLKEFGKRIGKDLLEPRNGHENVVLQIKKVMLQILPSHEMLLNEISTVMSNWDSTRPNMAKVIFTYAEFLKCCQPFLDKKAEFMSQLLALRNENKDFDDVTYMFEMEIFKHGKKGAVIQQLDQVHQNFMRYKLLMLRYSEYLKDGTDEKKKALDTIEKLERVTQAVNDKMGLPTTEELTKLFYRFQGLFNVWEPGRKLIRQARVMKQTRKERQTRHLVLFSDFLWICRISTSRSANGQFERNKSYQIPVEGIRLDTMDHEDYSCSLVIRSKVRSAIVIFSSEKERDQWMEDIQKAIYDRRAFKRRQSEAITKQTMNRKQLSKLMEKAKASGAISELSLEADVDRPRSLSESRTRSHSLSEEMSDGFSSVPDTPIESTSGSEDLNAFLSSKVGQVSSPNGGMQSLPKKINADVKPVWLPDNSSSACLMQGCGTEFNLINRRHHCRDCGWLICRDCKGQAPLSKYEYRKQNVCPECYERIHAQYFSGFLFPQNRVTQGSDGTCMVRVGKKHESQMIEARKLFKPPYNINLKKIDIESKNTGLAFGKVYLRQKKNAETVRHALLTQDLRLLFYKAELDLKPVMEVLIHGYKYREIELEGKQGWLFELVHRNQIRTDAAKSNVMAFRVDKRASAMKWSSALEQVLCVDEGSATDGSSPTTPNED